MRKQKIIDSFVSSGAIQSYTTNKFFENNVLQKEYYPYQFDGWKENKFYGLVDNKNRAIFPKNSILFTNNNGNANNSFNLVFVIDAYTDMLNYQRQFLGGNRLSKDSTFYLNPQIQKGAIEIDQVYTKYMNDILKIFNNTFLSPARVKKIKNFSSFLDIFIDFIKLISKISPINRSSYIKSDLCDLALNGLVLNFDTRASYSDTRTKADVYLSDPNFDVFLDSARRFGFLVDRNAPWRIVADLASPVMQRYYSSYGFRDLDTLFSQAYHVAHYTDLEVLKTIILAAWSNYVEKNPVYKNQTIGNGCVKLFAEISELKPISDRIFDANYGTNWLLRLYMFTKYHELDLNFSQKVFENYYQEAIKLFEYSSLETSLDYINSKLESLSSRAKQKNPILTSKEEAVRLLAIQDIPDIQEGINF
jgi:hypothetical protein